MSLPAAHPPHRPIPGPLRLLLRVNWLQGSRRLAAIRKQSRLLSSLIGVFIIGYLLLAFFIFRGGMRFIGSFPGLGPVLVERLIYLLFAFLFVLLLFSNLVISYTNFFRNRETQFLLTLPIPAQTVFRWKFIESILLASWAFLFLIAPLLAAYGLTQEVAWDFYLFTLLLIAIFIVLPGVAGSWSAIYLARYLDRKLFQILAVLFAFASLAAIALWGQPEAVTDEMLETRVLVVLDRLLDKTRFALNPILPSYWLSTSVLQWAERAHLSAVFFATLLFSHALFFGFIAFHKLGDLFYDAISTVQSRGSAFARWDWFQRWQRKRATTALSRPWLDRALAHLPFLSRDVRALIGKDARVFWRDTTQWGQTLMLFGLLGAYILNLRHFTQQLNSSYWVHVISYLNLGACSLNLATLTTRFVYPQFSLEGKRLWIVGMAPLGLPRVVRTKFALATASSLVITLSLVLLSCQMLKLPFDRTFYFCTAITVMTFALNGLAVGLGVLYPNFKEDNPSKIVSGFGGTFCLVLSFLYIVASVALLAIGSPWSFTESKAPEWVASSWILFVSLSLLAGWFPLHIALRRIENFEL